MLNNIFDDLSKDFKGDLLKDKASKIIYATDASVYYEQPQAIAIPKDDNDIKILIDFANKHKLPLIPRAAGTSLAGQVVGNGIVVDISKHFRHISNIDTVQKSISVQPGVILEELNSYLATHNLFFGPETSTANRCTIGGMVGNNACGLHAVIYGTTRDHLLEVSGYLSDGSKVTFKELTKDEFQEKCSGSSLESKIYRQLKETLDSKENQAEIVKNYPNKALIRRNNGYAIDQLLYNEVYSNSSEKINLSKLIAGSEGTLLFITQIKLNLVDLPAKNTALLCAHFESINEALEANITALKHKVTAVELMDDIILNASSKNIDQNKNRFFIEGNPKAILMIEFVSENKDELSQQVQLLIEDMKAQSLGYHYPILYNEDTKKAWNLRKAGLGIMSNIPGDEKSITVIEDTAVLPELLPTYIKEFTKIMDAYGKACVYHAHVGTGEIHLRPRLDLKKESDIKIFENIAQDIAHLVKKYKGSLSGEHGDGRLRGQFTPFMLGEKVYKLLVDLKNTWDPYGIFNPGKIINTPPMRENLRYKIGETKHIETYLDFSNKGGIIRATESCNGSADCRKSHTASGTMCPSYQATHDEKHSTRARANTLRDFLVNSNQENVFNYKEIYDSFALCLSCKACKSECPSSVDVAKLKAEFLQHYYNANGIPFRTKAIANISKLNKLAAHTPRISNFFLQNRFTSVAIKSILGIAIQRSLPKIQAANFKKQAQNTNTQNKEGVILFIDEFTLYNDAHLAKIAIDLLDKLGFEVTVVDYLESGRAYFSKGLLKKAKEIANKTVSELMTLNPNKLPIVGIEPSALLTFRDEFPEIVNTDLVEDAKILAKQTYLIEEFIADKIQNNQISQNLFTSQKKEIKFHGHCQQKAIASTIATKAMLSFPQNYSVVEIPSGCCGMAGSFGYEKENFDVSMKIGELVLFPEIRKTGKEVTISASGTSCRHQIYDGTNRNALHPIEIFYEAMRH